MLVNYLQPPLRGCVLKLLQVTKLEQLQLQPPLRGCVLKLATLYSPHQLVLQAAASARLCVETFYKPFHFLRA